MVHLRLLHLVEELPCVGRETFDITPLSLGEECIKGERGLPRTARPRDDHELIARNLNIDVAQVVLPRPLDSNDLSVGHWSENELAQP